MLTQNASADAAFHLDEAHRDDGESKPTTAQSMRRVLALLEDRFSVYHPKLTESLGDPKTALLLGRALSWTRLSLQKNPELRGWIWQTAEQFAADTGLSRFEQASARTRLKAMGLWEEQRAGMPARLHFRVNLDALAIRLSANASSARSKWSWEPDTLRDLLGSRPVIVHHRLVELVDDALTGLYLSQLLTQLRADLSSGKQKANTTSDSIGIEQTRHRVSMTRKMQRRCRNILIAKRLLLENYTSGLSPRLISSLDLDRLATLLTQQIDAEVAPSRNSLTASKARQLGLPLTEQRAEQPGLPHQSAVVDERQTARKPIETYSVEERDTPDCGNPAIKDVEIQHPVVALSSKQDCPEPENRTVPNLKTRFEETDSTYTVIKKIEDKTYHLPSHSDTVTPFRESGSRRFLYDLSELRGLAPSETVEVERLAQHAAERGQVLIDELAWAQRNALRPVGNPVAYLFALVKKFRAGTFIAAGAGRMEALRQRQRDDAEAQAVSAQVWHVALSPETQARNTAAREQAFAEIYARRASRGAAR